MNTALARSTGNVGRKKMTVLLLLAGLLVLGGPAHAGFNASIMFITEPTETDLLNEGYMLQPYNYFTSGFNTNGALNGHSQAELEQAVADAVQKMYRSAEINMPGRMLNVNIVLNASLTPQQGLIQLVGNAPTGSIGSGTLGIAWVDLNTPFSLAYWGNTTGLTLSGALAGMGGYLTFEHVVNALAGTTAHEIGHSLGLYDHDPGIPNANGVYPIMGTGATPPNPPTPNSARLGVRGFIDMGPTQHWNGGAELISTPQVLVRKAGTTAVTDFNFSGLTDIDDYNTCVANLGRINTGVKTGDADNNGLTDGIDFNMVLANLSSVDGALTVPTIDAASIRLLYNPETGTLTLSMPTLAGENAGLNSLLIASEALSKPFTTFSLSSTAKSTWALAGGWVQDYFNGMEQWLGLDQPMNGVTNLLLGTWATDLTAEDWLLPIEFSATAGEFTSTYFGYVTIVPEPVTIGLLALGGLALLRRRK